MSEDDRPDVLNYMEIEAYVEALQNSKTRELGRYFQIQLNFLFT